MGMFEAANDGTLFLDEIGDITLEMQAKLLRIIEEKEFRPLGASFNMSAKKSNFRLICATNRSLVEDIAKGGFREDLYYRINVVELHIPPLRDRKEDILPLIKDLIANVAQIHNLGFLTITDSALNLLNKYDWPGNVRELRNVIERAAILARLNGKIEATNLPLSLQKPNLQAQQVTPMTHEEQHRYNALVAYSFNMTKAAAALGMTRAAFQKYVRGARSDGSLIHPLLNRLYEEGKAAVKARTSYAEAVAITRLPPTSTFLVEDDF
jgi:Nif-specific regulatory protein